MKKILSLVALLGAIGGAASAAPYYVPTTAGGELTAYDWQPVYSVDALYNFTKIRCRTPTGLASTSAFTATR